MTWRAENTALLVPVDSAAIAEPDHPGAGEEMAQPLIVLFIPVHEPL
jgi:hypothetical protein